MRIFIATGIFHPESGGPATYLNGILPDMQQAGNDIRLLTFGEATAQDSQYGYPVQRIPRRAFALRPLPYAAYGLASRPYLGWADLTYLHSIGLPLWLARRNTVEMIDMLCSTVAPALRLSLMLAGRKGSTKEEAEVADPLPGVENHSRARAPVSRVARKKPVVRTVLLVEDERRIRMQVKKALEMHGYEVLSAGNGLEGVEIFRDHATRIAVVLLDMTLPFLSGEETLREMQRIHGDVSALLLSGYSDEDASERYAERGFVGFVQKPVQPDLLIHKVRVVLERGAASRKDRERFQV